MCVTCGCSDDSNAKIANLETGESVTIHANGNSHHSHTHTLPDGTVITHSHSHGDNHEASQVHAKIHGTTISLEKDILAKNNLIAAQNRGWFKGRNILALNLMSSPGAGKTTLLTRTIHDLKNNLTISVIEGDQETINDAKKIQETGCKVVQINTGTGCHLDAAMIDRGLQQLNPPLDSVVMIENVGNLVCPALFDLGENLKVVILSVTEGEDKPIKYPHIFRASEIMILTKIDLLPYVQFDVQKCIEYAQQVNPHIQIFQVSALTGTGLENWYEWLTKKVANMSSI
ncbi:hydrogenase nickel incorporation protein HypB [Chlorogloeopsis sp. ULAP01]|uniref:hydrogenase nickel incorporation protein HypB n=1 Tax=Chlorogloeopsis sp. ULAP01 TaxID=3056483 RepID=UPI0025AAF3A7|nr:hydrogenase nickel incorporation protein HypB [Chlorogloeopsis sp. ULAP01]MDM9383911.1 hydrogenase nickel incorporation protein HypB [Chlorogloeopsis sp. ULAP01]